MFYAALTGAAARVLLAWSGIGQYLGWRIEVSTAANSNLELREGLALSRFGISPYSGSSCRTPPLALWLYGSLAEREDPLYILPNTLLDLTTAALLFRLIHRLLNLSGDAGRGTREGTRVPLAAGCRTSALPYALAWAYLLNPFTLAASVGGTTSSLESLAIVAALYGACVRRPALAALGLAAASYMSLSAAVLLFPIACLLSYGPADVATAQRHALSGAPTGCSGAGAAEPVRLLAQESTVERELGATRAKKSQQQEQQQQVGAALVSEADRSAVGNAGKKCRHAKWAPKAAPAVPVAEVDGGGQEATAGAVAPQPPSAKNRSNGKVEAAKSGHVAGFPADAAAATAAAALGDRGQEASTQAAALPRNKSTNAVASAPAAALPPSPAAAGPSRALPMLPWSGLARCAALTAAMFVLLIAASDVYLLSLPSPPGVELPNGSGGGGDSDGTAPCILAVVRHFSVPAAGARRAPAAAGAGALAAAATRRLAAASDALASCWAVRVYGSQLLLDDATPNIGQWWYLSMEVFEDSKAYLRLLAHSLLFATAPPLAMRLGVRRSMALFVVQVLCLALLKPYPSVADAGLSASLLLLLLPSSSFRKQQREQQQQQAMSTTRLRLLLPASLVLLCVLGPAMHCMWLSYESANSNFFYSITLLYGVWQVVLIGQVLGFILRTDRAARGKEGG